MCSVSGDWLVIAVRARGIVEAWILVVWWVGEGDLGSTRC